MSKPLDPKALMEAARERQKKKAEEKREGRANMLLEIADNVRSQLALVASDAEDGEAVALYSVDGANVVRPVSDKEVEATIFRLVPQLLKKDRSEVLSLIKLQAFTQAPLNLERVQPVAFADEPTQLTFNRLSISRGSLYAQETAPLTAFKHILSLCDDARALVLWIGSLLDAGSGRTQYLHLHGGGGNGKSTLFNAIGRVLGERYVVTTRADEFQNQHWGSILEGTRLLIFPDENNPGFFSTGKFKEFTGEDATTVNPKYEKPRRIRLTHRTAVFSNNRVEISSSVADRRRLLSISMSDDPDGNIGHRWWFDELKNSGEAILAYCFAEYERAVREDPSIRAFIPQREEAVNAAISRKYADLSEVITDLYTITGSTADVVKKADVHEEILNRYREKRTNRFLMQQIREALIYLGVAEGAINGTQYYRGLKEVRGGFSVERLPKI